VREYGLRLLGQWDSSTRRRRLRQPGRGGLHIHRTLLHEGVLPVFAAAQFGRGELPADRIWRRHPAVHQGYRRLRRDRRADDRRWDRRGRWRGLRRRVSDDARCGGDRIQPLWDRQASAGRPDVGQDLSRPDQDLERPCPGRA